MYTALSGPRKAEEIAKHTGVSVTTVRRVISSYKRLGIAAIETPGTGGRRHEYLSLEEEQQFLAPFFVRAEMGTIATAAEVQRAFETHIGHEVDESTIYLCWLLRVSVLNLSVNWGFRRNCSSAITVKMTAIRFPGCLTHLSSSQLYWAVLQKRWEKHKGREVFISYWA